MGRTVEMCKAIWGGSADEYYYGTVLKKQSIKYKGDMRSGYDIKWGPGDIENWGEKDVLEALVPECVNAAEKVDPEYEEFVHNMDDVNDVVEVDVLNTYI